MTGFSVDCTARFGDCVMYQHRHCSGCYGVLYREGDGGYVDESGKSAKGCVVCDNALCAKCKNERAVCPQCVPKRCSEANCEECRTGGLVA
jgi:hypothetical protein